MSNDIVPAGAPISHDLKTFDDCLRAAQALGKKSNGDDFVTILVAAAALNVDDLQAELLIQTIAHQTMFGVKMVRKTWKKYKEEADKEREKEERRKAQERAADYAAKAQAVKDAIREQLLK